MLIKTRMRLQKFIHLKNNLLKWNFRPLRAFGLSTFCHHSGEWLSLCACWVATPALEPTAAAHSLNIVCEINGSEWAVRVCVCATLQVMPVKELREGSLFNQSTERPTCVCGCYGRACVCVFVARSLIASQNPFLQEKLPPGGAVALCDKNASLAAQIQSRLIFGSSFVVQHMKIAHRALGQFCGFT